ncbi:MAG: gcrA cell cycle regulator family protein [Rhodospirillales bacterium]|nr:gcrA cell cycle regulator family protein [Alphaproteobacteria bacterium]USO04000.1 MAG: gcrA cell cycle regulator family protein [Rhodospirillales bacterium]
MSWTDERVNLLKQLWGEGKTAAEIAKTLGDGVTRNAVIGKAHRLKLSSRLSPIQQNAKPQKTTETPKSRKRIPKQPEFKGKEIPLVDLEAGMCRWPSGDPREEAFSFCGHEVAEGLPYCKTHAAAAYQTVSRNRKLNAKDFAEDAGAPQEFEIKTAINDR